MLRNVMVDSFLHDEPEKVKEEEDMLSGSTKASGMSRSTSASSLASMHETTQLYPLIPELYIVPEHLIELEKKNPGSQVRLPNENVPLVWAQSLSILGDLLYENLLSPEELDPVGRRLNVLSGGKSKRHGEVVVQISLLTDSVELRDRLAMYGLETQTIEEVSPIKVLSPSALVEAFSFLGHNRKLGLTGRPPRPIGTLSTCKIYRFNGHL
jgi:hypothetical protein